MFLDNKNINVLVLLLQIFFFHFSKFFLKIKLYLSIGQILSTLSIIFTLIVSIFKIMQINYISYKKPLGKNNFLSSNKIYKLHIIDWSWIIYFALLVVSYCHSATFIVGLRCELIFFVRLPFVFMASSIMGIVRSLQCMKFDMYHGS